tara:strand:+ start:1347 stop:1778 length:432 start_codon:yes stop_codon:yes gene_type:complete
MSKTSIFASEHNESAVQTVRSTMQVSLNDDGTPVVSFATNRGKGSGAQTMPVSEFREYVDTLSEYADNGIPDESDIEQLSPAETVRRTIRSEDGSISFRVRSGKGAKPAKIAADEFTEVVSLLEGTLDAVEGAAAQLAGGSEE